MKVHREEEEERGQQLRPTRDPRDGLGVDRMNRERDPRYARGQQRPANAAHEREEQKRHGRVQGDVDGVYP